MDREQGFQGEHLESVFSVDGVFLYLVAAPGTSVLWMFALLHRMGSTLKPLCAISLLG